MSYTTWREAARGAEALAVANAKSETKSKFWKYGLLILAVLSAVGATQQVFPEFFDETLDIELPVLLGQNYALYSYVIPGIVGATALWAWNNQVYYKSQKEYELREAVYRHSRADNDGEPK